MNPDRDLLELEAIQTPEDSSLLDLDSIWSEAQTAIKARQQRNKTHAFSDAVSAAEERIRARFSLPENWERKRCVALVDRRTHSLLGCFGEYQHRFSSAKKYLREADGQETAFIVEVDGYAGEALAERTAKVWEEFRETVADLSIPELGVLAPAVSVRVCLYLNYMERIELLADTQFASTSGRTLLLLSAGTDIIRCLSADSKRSIAQAVGVPLQA